jgi:hypothetical protein
MEPHGEPFGPSIFDRQIWRPPKQIQPDICRGMGSKIELFENAQAHWPKAGTPGGGCLVAPPWLAKGKVHENAQEFAESRLDP